MPVLTAPRIAVRKLTEQDRPRLEAMYQTFHPQDAAFGLPPGNPLRRKMWLNQILRGVNLAAFSEEQIVGHMFLIPGGESTEMAVFVHQSFRRQGIARELFQVAVEEARALGLHSMWVLAGGDNYEVRAAMRSFGFRVSAERGTETEMTFRL